MLYNTHYCSYLMEETSENVTLHDLNEAEKACEYLNFLARAADWIIIISEPFSNN